MVSIKFEGSLSEETSGASFEIKARDQKHAREIAQWLRSACKDKTKVFITAVQELPVQVCTIEV